MITAEQINALKPSWENQIEIIWEENGSSCFIISPVVDDEVAVYRGKNLGFYYMSLLDLQEYTFPEKPKKTLYQFIYKNVTGAWCNGFTLITRDGYYQDGKKVDYEEFRILENTAVEVDNE